MTCPTYKMRILIFPVSINLIFSWDISLEILLSNELLNCHELTIITKKDNLKRKLMRLVQPLEVVTSPLLHWVAVIDSAIRPSVSR